MSRRPLATLFADLNRSHFGGRLPPYRVLRVRSMGRAKAIGDGWIVQTAGECNPRRRTIRILDVLPAEVERRSLLHEMAHAFVGRRGGHGRAWRAMMQRLAVEHGETWALADAERYTSRRSPVRDIRILYGPP